MKYFERLTKKQENALKKEYMHRFMLQVNENTYNNLHNYWGGDAYLRKDDISISSDPDFKEAWESAFRKNAKMLDVDDNFTLHLNDAFDEFFDDFLGGTLPYEVFTPESFEKVVIASEKEVHDQLKGRMEEIKKRQKSIRSKTLSSKVEELKRQLESCGFEVVLTERQ